MAFITRKDIGRLYVIRMTMKDGEIVHKIGMCNSSRSTDRMIEIVRSWFNSFRFIPYTELRLDMQCCNPRMLEKYIHKILRPVAYTPKYKVEGSTEMFYRIDENRLIWFLKAFEKSNYTTPPEVEESYNNDLCKWITNE